MKSMISPSIIVLVICILLGCGPVNKIKTKVPNSAVTTGLYGRIESIEGNQMPQVGKAFSKAKPLQTRLYIFPPLENTDLLQVEGQWCQQVQQRPIQIVSTDSIGRYHITMVPGRYSILVAAYGGYFVPFFNQFNQPGVVDIQQVQKTELNILVNSKAIY